MMIRVDTELCLPPDDAVRLERMIWRGRASGALTVRLRIDPLSPSVFLAVFSEGDASQVVIAAELDEEADAVLFVVRERTPDRPTRGRTERRLPPVTIPVPFTVALDADTGGIVMRPAPDAPLRRVH